MRKSTGAGRRTERKLDLLLSKVARPDMLAPGVPNRSTEPVPSGSALSFLLYVLRKQRYS